MPTFRGRLALLVTLAVPLGGCILFVDDDTTNYTVACGFPGGGGGASCGACIASSCASAVADCCASRACATELSITGASCAAGNDPSACSAFGNLVPAFGACIEESCPSCGSVIVDASPDNLLQHSPGYLSCMTQDDGCSCYSDDFDPGVPGPKCDVTAIDNLGLCCADDGWPEAGTGCTCYRYSCEEDSTGGSCTLSSTFSGTGTWDADGGTCCVDFETCSCEGEPECSSGQTVSECSLTVARCPAGKNRVDSCSTGTFLTPP